MTVDTLRREEIAAERLAICRERSLSFVNHLRDRNECPALAALRPGVPGDPTRCSLAASLAECAWLVRVVAELPLHMWDPDRDDNSVGWVLLHHADVRDDAWFPFGLAVARFVHLFDHGHYPDLIHHPEAPRQ